MTMNQSEKRMFLIQSLLNERPSCQKQIIPADSERQKILLRGLMNVRRPYPVGAEFMQVQDEYLQGETGAKGVTDVANLTPVSGVFDGTDAQPARVRETSIAARMRRNRVFCICFCTSFGSGLLLPL